MATAGAAIKVWRSEEDGRKLLDAATTEWENSDTVNRPTYKDGAVFPRPGLAGVPHVQHMGTMNESWAATSPPSGMAMVGQPGGGPIKHLSGLGG